ncbi:MAG: transposase [Sphingobacteriales bacterium]|nr:MAG: transposase [Sphingobacteriales bacterium]
MGIDVSSKSHSVRIGYKLPIEETVHIGEEKTFANDDQGHEALLAYVTKFTHPDCTNRVFVMEATGIYHEDLAYYLDKSGAFVTVVLPSRAMAYKKSENVLSKTDGIDARLLVKMGLRRP